MDRKLKSWEWNIYSPLLTFFCKMSVVKCFAVEEAKFSSSVYFSWSPELCCVLPTRELLSKCSCLGVCSWGIKYNTFLKMVHVHVSAISEIQFLVYCCGSEQYEFYSSMSLLSYIRFFPYFNSCLTGRLSAAVAFHLKTKNPILLTYCR